MRYTERLHLLGSSENMGTVGGDGVDGRVVGPHLTQQLTALGGPELEHAAAAHGHEQRLRRHVCQPAHPVLVSVAYAL